ncbi:hypothetical protein Pfo_018224 [Paulownia fortunei]|nr:hypothetical protein Pfo_018224 [Paulownia fortunei]
MTFQNICIIVVNLSLDTPLTTIFHRQGSLRNEKEKEKKKILNLRECLLVKLFCKKSPGEKFLTKCAFVCGNICGNSCQLTVCHVFQPPVFSPHFLKKAHISFGKQSNF